MTDRFVIVCIKLGSVQMSYNGLWGDSKALGYTQKDGL